MLYLDECLLQVPDVRFFIAALSHVWRPTDTFRVSVSRLEACLCSSVPIYELLLSSHRALIVLSERIHACSTLQARSVVQVARRFGRSFQELSS